LRKPKLQRVKAFTRSKDRTPPPGAVFLFLGQNSHSASRAVESKTETTSVGRHKIIGLFERRPLTLPAAPPESKLQAMLAIHHRHACRLLLFVCGKDFFNPVLLVKGLRKTVCHISAIIYAVRIEFRIVVYARHNIAFVLE
jgi:hypothetical protein